MSLQLQEPVTSIYAQMIQIGDQFVDIIKCMSISAFDDNRHELTHKATIAVALPDDTDEHPMVVRITTGEDIPNVHASGLRVFVHNTETNRWERCCLSGINVDLNMHGELVVTEVWRWDNLTWQPISQCQVKLSRTTSCTCLRGHLHFSMEERME